MPCDGPAHASTLTVELKAYAGTAVALLIVALAAIAFIIVGVAAWRKKQKHPQEYKFPPLGTWYILPFAVHQ